ncbi:MAG: family 20 glycosylhydrolase [Acidobacteria bacterium]|nr:family 20 glycosylhydrolase [Acidobacteriota bacterium]
MQACSTGDVPVVQLPSTDVRVIPKPISVKRFEGSFTISGETKLVASDNSAMRAAALLNDELTMSHQIALQPEESAEAPGTILLTTRPSEPTGADESYDLKVTYDGITINATEKGLFHGVQTLLQLIEPDRQQTAEVPVVEISDSPRFKYRGMHLDTARHFMPVDFVKKYIRLIARYKFNYFHWHLTDDQGWRIEINKYPALTQKGSKRRETAVGKNYQPRPYIGNGVEHEGFYSQKDIRDIVAYAAAHNVTIIPEIDVRATHHSSCRISRVRL